MDILQASKQSRVSTAYYLLRKKTGFFLEPPQQLRLTFYLVSNFLATLSVKLISFHSNLRLRGKMELFIKNVYSQVYSKMDYVLCHSARDFRVFSFK